jgi:hypothetical protein
MTVSEILDGRNCVRPRWQDCLSYGSLRIRAMLLSKCRMFSAIHR